MPSTVEFLLAEAQAFKNVLKSQSNEDKKKHVPIQTAKQFNAILDKAKKQVPDSAAHLPEPVEWNAGNLLTRSLDVTMITYVDLEIKLDTLLGVLTLLKSGH